MSPEQATAALLERGAGTGAARCRAARERAAAAARTLLRAAHAEARAQVRGALEEARKSAAERVALAEAQGRTRARAARQRLLKAQLEKTRPLLGELLRQSWQDPVRRERWAERYARRALEVLPRGRWQVRHPPEWPRAEQARLAEILSGGSIQAQLAPDPAIAAGLKFVSGNSLLDATGPGLLADRTAIEARLLFHAGNKE